VTPLRNVSVFCGSHLGNGPTFRAAATGLGTALAARGIGLVYGGASVGLMGVLADAVLAAGGRVLSRLDIVPTMHERKALMAELSDAVIMLPGGFGTYDEFMESVTWAHLGLHAMPSAILNVDGFFDGLLSFLSHAAQSGFIHPQQIAAIVTTDDPLILLEALAQGAA
jgi:predicted Rossmann-fold nucleotide-binding protein